MKFSIWLGLILLALEFVWMIYWFSLVCIYNTWDGVPVDMEESHFTAVIRAVGLPVVIITIFELLKERPDSVNLVFQTLALLIVIFIDVRGVLHTFIHFSDAEGTYYWRLFAASALMAIIFTSLEFGWLLLNSLPHFPDAFSKITNMLRGKKSEESLEDPLLTREPIARKMVGLKSF